MQIGLISPPVGMNMFVVKSMLPRISTATIFRGVTPFVVAEVVLLALAGRVSVDQPGAAAADEALTVAAPALMVLRKGVVGQRAQRLCGAEERQGSGPSAARSAHPPLTWPRVSERRERSERSELPRPGLGTEHRRGVGPKGRPPQRSGDPLPATPLRARSSRITEPGETGYFSSNDGSQSENAGT